MCTCSRNNWVAWILRRRRVRLLIGVTRVAVVERAMEDSRARKDDRDKDVARFDTRRFELTTRLQEAETFVERSG